MTNKFCVYLHKTLSGDIFYIGSGTLARAKTLELSKRQGRATKRGKYYSDFVATLDYKYDYEIIKIFNTSEDAISFEISEYDRLINNGVNLLNYRGPSRVKEINVNNIGLFVYYDISSESCLRWKDNIKAASKRHCGTIAGSKMTRGCYQVKIEGINFLVHRVIAELHGLSTTGMVVDHINGDPSDNRIENLRVCSNAENARNKKKQNNNKSGTPGVCYSIRKEAWIAIVKIHSKTKERSFSVKKYGFEEAKNLAITARFQMLEDAEKMESFIHVVTNGQIYSIIIYRVSKVKHLATLTHLKTLKGIRLMSITKLNGTLVYVQLDQPKPCYVADKGSEWKTSIVVDEETADLWDEQFPKQPAKQVKTSEFESLYKIAPPHPDQRKQYVITLRKNTKLGNGNDVPIQYQPKLFQQKGNTLVDITKSVLVSNGSLGSVSVDIYEGKMGPVARLKNIKVDELIEYVRPERTAAEPGSEFDTADDGNGGTVRVPAKAKTAAKPAAKKQAEDEDDNPF